MFGSTTSSSHSTKSIYGFPSVFGQSNQSSNPFAPQPIDNGIPFDSLISTVAFGQTSSALSSPTIFGVPLFSGFGSSMTASNFSSAPAFGGSSSSFGGSSVFMQKPAFGASSGAGAGFRTMLFGENGSHGATASVFGNLPFGCQRRGSRVCGYQKTADIYGYSTERPGETVVSISAMPVYIGKSHEELRWEDRQLDDKGGFGESSSHGTTASIFGSQNSLFESQFTTPTFRSTGFGNSAFGFQTKGLKVESYQKTVIVCGYSTAQPGEIVVSISAMPVYRHKSHEELRWEDSQFGEKDGLGRSSSHGMTASSFGTQNSVSGRYQGTTPSFGSTVFGNSAFGCQRRGSRVESYEKTASGDSMERPGDKVVSICAMPAYKDKSHEELRWEDSQCGDKGGFRLHASNQNSASVNPVGLFNRTNPFSHQQSTFTSSSSKRFDFPPSSSSSFNNSFTASTSIIPPAPALKLFPISTLPSQSCSNNRSRNRNRTKNRKREPAERFPSFMCEICAEPKPCNESFFITGCSCKESYCSECMIRYVASKIRENITQIRCPGASVSGCEGQLDPEHCRDILPEEVFDRWGNALCEAGILASEKFYCPFKDCSALLIDDRNSSRTSGISDGHEAMLIDEDIITQSECPHCWRLFCVQCQVPWHSGIECAEVQKLNKDEREREDILVMQLAKKNKWIRCPKCRFIVEKSQGCLQMKCRCGYTFCYNCGAPMRRHYCTNCKH